MTPRRGCRLQACELAVGDHGARRLTGWRAAWRLERNREHRIAIDLAKQALWHGDASGLLRIDEAQRVRLVAWWDQPQFEGLLLIAGKMVSVSRSLWTAGTKLAWPLSALSCASSGGPSEGTFAR